jgi:hypothetical protein
VVHISASEGNSFSRLVIIPGAARIAVGAATTNEKGYYRADENELFHTNQMRLVRDRLLAAKIPRIWPKTSRFLRKISGWIMTD